MDVSQEKVKNLKRNLKEFIVEFKTVIYEPLQSNWSEVSDLDRLGRGSIAKSKFKF